MGSEWRQWGPWGAAQMGSAQVPVGSLWARSSGGVHGIMMCAPGAARAA